jgi:peptide/nickel transport system substrate-binding protein
MPSHAFKWQLSGLSAKAPAGKRQDRTEPRLVTLFRMAPLAGLLAAAPVQAQTLIAGMAAPVTSMDPHFLNAAPNNGVTGHIFEHLVGRYSTAEMVPELALSWSPIGESSWEFRLRPGVKWQDGREFTPDDVAFTVGRAPNVPNSPGGFAGQVRAIQSVEVVDPHTIRFHTAAPAPNLPGDLCLIGIISRHAGEGAATEDYNSGKAAIGTGPYRLVRYTSGDRIELARNDAWWGPQQEWQRVSFRFIPSPPTRVAALLSADVDLIDVPPATDLPRLVSDPRLTVTHIQGLRLIFLFLNGQERSPPDITDVSGSKLAKNPLLDRRVREALSVAINRHAIAERVMLGTAEATGQWLPPGTFGYNPDVKPPAYAPERARSLLAEAGFPNGLHVVLYTPNDRYPNDAATAQAVAQMWSRIGVQTQVEAMPWNTYSARANKQEFSIGVQGWGSVTGEAGYGLINIMGTVDPAASRGPSNWAHYSNPALDALTDKALSTIDDGTREKLLQQAVAMAMDDVAIIPLHQLENFWAMRKGLTYEPRMDERTLAMNAHTAR